MSSDPTAPPVHGEILSGVQRRRRWSTTEKIRLVEESQQPGSSVSFVARRYGLSPSLLFSWKRRMLEGGLSQTRTALRLRLVSHTHPACRSAFGAGP